MGWEENLRGPGAIAYLCHEAVALKEAFSLVLFFRIPVYRTYSQSKSTVDTGQDWRGRRNERASERLEGRVCVWLRTESRHLFRYHSSRSADKYGVASP